MEANTPSYQEFLITRLIGNPILSGILNLCD